MRQSGGHAKIYSEPGSGTTVNLYLPRYMDQEAPLVYEGRKSASPRPEGRSGETILVVEDEPGVRATTSETLRVLGYTVHSAPDGATALGILDQIQATPLFTDVVMPGMTGRELAQEAVKRQPGIKVLYTTGYTRNAIHPSSN
jgi:response regulator RpfG family c-di-GMP phosphodiesterase